MSNITSVVVLCILFATTAIWAVPRFSSSPESWTSFKAIHNKIYLNSLEDRARFNIFQENVIKIEEHNQLYERGLTSYFLGVNKFTDLTSEEFLSNVATSTITTIKTGSQPKVLSDAPESIDWRESNVVPQVHNQEALTQSWHFVTADTIGSTYAIQQNASLIEVSSDQLLDCANSTYAFEYVSENGIARADAYNCSEGCCYTADLEFIRTSGKVHFGDGNETLLQNVVADIGPVSIGIEVTPAFQFYVGGIFEDNSCSNQLNHIGNVVGYGAESGDEYWIVKNTWGAEWGEDGYIRMVRNYNNNCGIASFVTYPTF